MRAHVDDALWRSAWDFILPVTSALLALFFGVAFGNLVRGVPLGPDGWFALTLFTVVPSLPVPTSSGGAPGSPGGRSRGPPPR